MTEAAIDQMIDAFDTVRQRFQPTNGEMLAVFAVLASDVIALAGPSDIRLELMRPVVALLEVRANGDNPSLERQALIKLFQRCGLPPFKRTPSMPDPPTKGAQ